MSTTAFSEAPEQPSSKQFVTHWFPERAVLTHLLDQHPRRLTFQDLASEMGHGFRESTLRRAVDNLIAARFLDREGAALIAASAVVNFDRRTVATEF